MSRTDYRAARMAEYAGFVKTWPGAWGKAPSFDVWLNHQDKTAFRASETAAQAGAALAESALAAIRQTNDEAEAANELYKRMLALIELKNTTAIGGFAGAMVGVFKFGMLRQKRIRHHRDVDACPVCDKKTMILNVERDHFAVCHSCKIFTHIGENLFSAWRDENPEVWKANQKLLDGYTDATNLGTASQIDNVLMQNEVGRMMEEREIQNREIPNRKLMNAEQNRILDMAYFEQEHGEDVSWTDVAEDIRQAADELNPPPWAVKKPVHPWCKA